MKLIVFGASGKVGRLVVDEALRRGYEVTAFVHTAPLPEHPKLTIRKGDIYDGESVTTALAGHDAIISALGSWGTVQKNVLSTAMQTIVPAAESAGIERLVSVTGNAAAMPGEQLRFGMRLARIGLHTVAPKVLRDGEDHMEVLAKSPLIWTVLRSPVMTGEDNERYQLSLRSSSLTVSRHAVAKAMVDLVETREWPKTAPFIRKA